MSTKLSVRGEVSVKPSQSVSNTPGWYILILGPTGAGKSSFIEALSKEGQSLRISKDQLAGFTQEVTAYEIKNVTVKWDFTTYTIHLIDAPGFSDSKISELEIIAKVKQWMRDKVVDYIHGVLYLSPITDTRATGSKRRIIKMIQSLLYNPAFDSVNIVTTMWDTLSNPQAQNRAESNFAQLRDEIWESTISGGAKISRCYNNFDSAIQILRSITDLESVGYAPFWDNPIKPESTSAPLLYGELLYRISNARQEKELLRQDQIQLISKPDPQLKSVVFSRLPGVKNNLAKFLGQLVAFGTPPPGFEGVPEKCIYQYLLDQVIEHREEQAALEFTLARLHTIPDRNRKATLKDQLDVVKHELAKHVKRLGQYGAPPKCYEKELKRALDGIVLGASFQYHIERGLRFFKDKLGFVSGRKINH